MWGGREREGERGREREREGESEREMMEEGMKRKSLCCDLPKLF
jgi:hypothetical protein